MDPVSVTSQNFLKETHSYRVIIYVCAFLPIIQDSGCGNWVMGSE